MAQPNLLLMAQLLKQGQDQQAQQQRPQVVQPGDAQPQAPKPNPFTWEQMAQAFKQGQTGGMNSAIDWNNLGAG